MKRLFFVSLFISFHALADKTLRWGADVESGAPFAFKDPHNPEKVVGFEAEIAETLAHDMGMEPQFVQNQWEGLIQGLPRHDYDIVINGIEITEDRREVVSFSLPYYVTSEILTVLKSDPITQSLDDLGQKRVGTLDGSLAQRILESHKKNPKTVLYDDEIHAYDDLALERLDAVLLDEPIAIYYAFHNPKFRNLTAPIGRMEYGIAIPKDNPRLLKEINQSLTRLIQNGSLQTILERWGLWNKLTADLWKLDATPRNPPTSYQDYMNAIGKSKSWKDKVIQYIGFFPLLGKGALLTLGISIASMTVAILLGLLTALARLYGLKPMKWLALSYVEVMRGTPLLIQLYLIFYGLPLIGLRLEPFMAAVLGLGLNYAACEAENYRAGIQSIPRSQMDAAFALGMTRWQALRHVILPQAMRLVIPPVTNDFIALLKDSSLVSVITMVELTTIYGQLASTYFDYLGIGLLVAGMYFLVGLPFVRLSRYLEKNIRSKRRRPRLAQSSSIEAPLLGAQP